MYHHKSRGRAIPSTVLGRNGAQPIPLAWQPPTNPLAVQVCFDFLLVLGHQRLGIPPFQRGRPRQCKQNAKVHVELPTIQQRIHMTPPHGPHLVCPSALLANV